MACCNQIVCVIIILILLLSSTVAGDDACSTGLCTCSPKIATCSGQNLTYIPLLPSYIKLLYFKNNYIPHMTAASLSNLTNLRLVNLYMKHNHIRTIDNNAFFNLKRLKIIDLSNNFLTSNALYSVFIAHKNSLKDVRLSKNRIREIPSDLFKNIKSMYLPHLDLSYNNISVFNFTIFRPIKRFGTLNLNGNIISSLILEQSPLLFTLSLSSNLLVHVPNFCQKRSLFNNLQQLQLDNNSIHDVKGEYLSCMVKVNKLDLSNNYIAVLNTNSFHGLASLVTLNINNQRNQQKLQIRSRAFNNSHLEELLLDRNMLTTDNIHSEAFSGCHNLIKLHLDSNKFYVNTERLNVIFSPLLSLQVLRIKLCTITAIPDVIGEKLHNLTSLNVGANAIKPWSSNTFLNNTRLIHIDLHGNRLVTITKTMFPGYLRRRLKTIDLTSNPLICNCALVWFIQWMREEPNKFRMYLGHYTCLNITERICLKNTAAYLSLTTVTCLVAIGLLLTSMVYKYRWSIKYHIYMWRYRPLKMLDIAEKHFIYDAFVSYSIEDSDWVLDKLQPIMEDGEHLKLCIHQRDFEGGKLIIDNIIHHMENSRKVLIVLSNDFARSEWCQFEMSLAQKLVLDMSIESLVVVLLEDIDAANMSKSLHALFKTTTYITWDEDGEDDVLWLRLKESLKKRDLDDHALL